jgi:2-polyprenyl-3-methyl-5-hydroxy-6-metoxy-1,4-benzoquinol methylase
MSDKPWYKEWFNSPYYHLLYFNRDETEAKQFITELVKKLNAQAGDRVLDVACGRGRHSRILASLGFDVIGIDLAPDSIRIAKESEKENLHFYQHDMRLPYSVNYFDYAFNFFTSFGYFRTRRENENVVRTIADAIKHGGTLVMDYLNVQYAESHLKSRETKEINGIQFFLTRWFDENYFYKKVEVEDEALSEPYVITEQVSKFSLGDFNDMFAYHGLQMQEVYGDYQFGPYDVNKSPRLLMTAKKKD